MAINNHFDVIIIGGGLAGLAASIQLKNAGFTVALFEKEKYPFNKVCGEYISLESWAFIESLGLHLTPLQLPIINKLLVTAPNGAALQQALPLGGFGISRFLLDESLKNIAVQIGVQLFENCKVASATFSNNQFTVKANAIFYTSIICLGSFGKKSNLDVTWRRPFILNKNNALNNYIGVKYHIQTNQAVDTIALHNFKDGYCGVSKIEKNKYCLCYLTNAANLKNNDNSILKMEKNVLYKNPYLKNILTNCVHLFAQPITISQISFSKKNNVQQHILLMGDAAGMITPLCGNGMSMALHSSKITALLVISFLQQKIDRPTLEKQYATIWQANFGKRLWYGRLIQKFFGKVWLTNIFIAALRRMPTITNWLIKQTHGKPF